MKQEQHVQNILDEKVPPARCHHGNAGAPQPDHLGHQLKSIPEAHLASEDVESDSQTTDSLTINDMNVDLEKHTSGAAQPSLTKGPSNGLERYVSKDKYGNTYPEGGLRAWLVVYGAFSGMTASFGLMNSIGTFEAYLITHQLSDQKPATLGWVFSLYTFIAFFLGIQIGPFFDAKGPRLLILLGTVFLVGGTLAIAESTKLWHFILSFSVAGGLGTALIFTPAVASIAHFFFIKRAAATGLAATGGSIGGIIYPLMLQKLFPEVGFRWATRVLALIFLVQLVVANILVRSRLPPPPKDSLAASIWPDWRIFKNVTFLLTTFGTFFVEWALFVPLSYLTAYALKQGLDPAFSYQLLAILNAGSFFGRWLPGLFADKFGRFNAMIATVLICLMSVFCLWLTCSLSKNIVPQIIVFSLIFGFGSGSNISLVPVCVGQLCETEVFGRWYASLYMIVSFGCLTGIPVAGNILDASHGGYSGLICFVGACYGLGLACFTAARVREVGWKWTEKY